MYVEVFCYTSSSEITPFAAPILSLNPEGEDSVFKHQKHYRIYKIYEFPAENNSLHRPNNFIPCQQAINYADEHVPKIQFWLIKVPLIEKGSTISLTQKTTC